MLYAVDLDGNNRRLTAYLQARRPQLDVRERALLELLERAADDDADDRAGLLARAAALGERDG